MKLKFTKKNAAIASIIYQLYPIVLSAITFNSNPKSTVLGIIGIFVIAEFVLVCVLINWKKKSETTIIDERENLIRLKVSHYQLKTIEVIFVLSILLSFTVFKEMSGKLILGIMAIPIVFGEAYANIKFRKL